MEVVWQQMHNFYVTLRHYFPFWTSKVKSLNSLFYPLSVIAIALILLELWVGGPMVDPRWLPFSNYDLTNTLYSAISSRYKPQRKHLWVYYLSSKLIVKYRLSVIEDGVVPPPPPAPFLVTEDGLTPGLDRVNTTEACCMTLP